MHCECCLQGESVAEVRRTWVRIIQADTGYEQSVTVIDLCWECRRKLTALDLVKALLRTQP